MRHAVLAVDVKQDPEDTMPDTLRESQSPSSRAHFFLRESAIALQARREALQAAIDVIENSPSLNRVEWKGTLVENHAQPCWCEICSYIRGNISEIRALESLTLAPAPPLTEEAIRGWLESYADRRLGKGVRPCGWPEFGSIGVTECVDMLRDFAAQFGRG